MSITRMLQLPDMQAPKPRAFPEDRHRRYTWQQPDALSTTSTTKHTLSKSETHIEAWLFTLPGSLVDGETLS